MIRHELCRVLVARRCPAMRGQLQPVLLSEQHAAETEFHELADLETHGRVDVMEDMTSFDIERLHILISRHARLTGSKRAAEILANWKTWCPKFRKVMPVEYRRALTEMAKASLQGSGVRSLQDHGTSHGQDHGFP